MFLCLKAHKFHNRLCNKNIEYVFFETLVHCLEILRNSILKFTIKSISGEVKYEQARSTVKD